MEVLLLLAKQSSSPHEVRQKCWLESSKASQARHGIAGEMGETKGIRKYTVIHLISLFRLTMLWKFYRIDSNKNKHCEISPWDIWSKFPMR